MRALSFHCKNFSSKITGLSTRPADITHEEIHNKEKSIRDCILVFLTIESDDTADKIPQLIEEIVDFCKGTDENNVFLCPFAHLSNELASSDKSLKILNKVERNLDNRDKLNIFRGHFGSDKELVIHLYGHPGNARYREF